MLGMGGINSGVITEDAMERAIQTLREFKQICSDEGVGSVKGIGTSAMRGASNSGRLVEMAKKELQLEILIVSGEDEAELIYRGVKMLHEFDSPAMIMDIGGGSTEYIFADANGVTKAGSFDVGVSRIYQKLDMPETFNDSVQQAMDALFELEMGTFFQGMSVHQLIGASGSFETFYEMIRKETFPKANYTVSIPKSELLDMLVWSLKSTLDDRIENPWIVPMRKKMLPIAAYSVLWTMEKLQTQEVLVSPYSLKEGAFSV